MVYTRKTRRDDDDDDDDIDICDIDHNDDIVHKDEATTKEKVAVISLLVLIGAQMVTKKLGVLTPATLLSTLTTFVIDWFKLFGGKFVNFSIEVARYISIKELALSVFDLFNPFFQLLVSPYNFLLGIVEASSQNVGLSTISVLTTLTIMLVVFVLAQRNVYNMLKPSVLLSNLKDFVTRGYSLVGEWLASVSAIYRVLKLDRFIEDALEILQPVADLGVAPLETVRGYADAVRTSRYFSERKGRLVSGAGVLVAGGVTLFGIYYYGFSLS
jgi:hypothetical protein